MKIHSIISPQPKPTEVGGKGFNLFRLAALSLPVPTFVVLDQNVLEQALPENIDALSEEELILQIDRLYSDDAIRAELEPHFEAAEAKLFAVRSSGMQEDGKDFSFAGQFESYLYVSFRDLPHFIREVWKSNFSQRVRDYHERNGLKMSRGIAVVVQEMIDPEVSGVGFGIDPNSGEPGSKVICSVYGVGEGLVSGELNADTFRWQIGNWQEELVEKTRAGRRAASGKIAWEAVEAEHQNAPSLNPAQLEALKGILEGLETALGAPQDVEFAVSKGKIYLLQTRPITRINKRTNRVVWDNSNIIESYPGVTTPLTFSYILEAYQKVYEQLALIMGASPRTVAKNEETFANMLGLLRGRVYYNLRSWYKVLSLFPGYRLNARFMETMMGVKERFDLPKEQEGSKVAAVFRTALMIIRIAQNLATIKKQTRRFLADVSAEIERIQKLPMDKMDAFELMQLWQELDATLTPKWKAPLINDSFAMLYFGRLKAFIEANVRSENENLHNDLLCGSRDIISVEPIHRSIALATEISAIAELKSLFIEHSPAVIWSELQNHSILAEIQRYLHDFGDRCIGELKLETISHKQDPTLFIATLKSFVQNGITTESSANSVDLDLRRAAEAEINRALKGKWWKRRKLNKLLDKARYFVSNRENLRYERTRVFGLTREIFTQIGRVFEAEGVLNNYRDIFFLTKDEIFGYICGTAVDTDLKALTALRKEEYAAYAEEEAPAERVETFGAVHIANDFYPMETAVDHQGELKGLGCCPGIVKGRVRVVRDPLEIDDLNGDILVTSSTDPGWVTLFPTTSAIIVERGSLLSHSAIVSREMGIPCIVGVSGLLKTLKTGDVVQMNGSTGKIQIISHE